MPAPSIKYELIRVADISNTVQGLQVKRGVLVKDLPININVALDADPSVLLNGIGVAGFPQLYSLFPDSRYSWLILKEQNLVEVVSKTCIKYQLVYRGFDPSAAGSPAAQWTIRDGYTMSYVPTFSSADDSFSLQTFYQQGSKGRVPWDSSGNAIAPEPPGSSTKKGYQKKVAKVHKPLVHRQIVASQVMDKSVWNTLKPQMRALAGKINKTPWNGPRGTWYFTGPESTTTDVGQTMIVRCTFLNNVYGWYPVAAWFSKLGDHPTDCDTEKYLRSFGIPDTYPKENDILCGNGITICSVTGEGDFNTVFAPINDI
jgi:hypothetical protein